MPPVTVTIITKNEADHIEAAIDSAAWADEIVVVDSHSTDDTVARVRAKGVRVETRDWPGWVEQKNFAAGLASHDWIFSLDADERLTPALADEIRRVLGGALTMAAYRVPRVTFHLGQWIRTTDFYPDFQTRLYDRRVARWQGRFVHESVAADGPVGTLTQELLHYSYRDLADHLDRINHYTTLAARQMFERGRRASSFDLVVQGPAAFLRNYVLRRGFLDGTVGFMLSAVNAYAVFLKFAKLWQLGRARPASSTSWSAASPMFSLHIDSARGWRGGQGQVKYTVLGLRQRGDRAALVAHPDGELFKRMSEGLDLIPLAPRNEVDLAAAWRLSRVLRQYGPDVIQAHDPHALAMAATALAISAPTPKPPLIATRRVDFHIAHNSFSRWKYGQVDCFIAITNAIADMLVADGIPRARIALVNEGVDVERIAAMPAANVHAECFLPVNSPVVGNVAALVPHKGQHYLIEAAAIVVRRVPDVRFVILGEGELREQLEREIKQKHLERHVFLAGFRGNPVELTKSFDVFVMSSLTEGLCTALVDAMAASRPTVATTAGGIPEVVVDGETGFLVPPRDPNAMAERIVELLTDAALRQRMGQAGLARARARFTVERMVEETNAVYERAAGTRREADTARRAGRG